MQPAKRPHLRARVSSTGRPPPWRTPLRAVRDRAAPGAGKHGEVREGGEGLGPRRLRAGPFSPCPRVCRSANSRHVLLGVYTVRAPPGDPLLSSVPPRLHLLPAGQAPGLERGEAGREGGVRVQERRGLKVGCPQPGRSRDPRGRRQFPGGGERRREGGTAG